MACSISQSWGPLANLAYGITTVFDPSPLSIDMLAYEDLVDTGQMLGSRIHSTGPALFSFNRFESPAHVARRARRYRDHYHTLNLKQYRAGNRRVRQWIADAARDLGMMPTCEGALSMKQNLTQILDGYSGFEHALTAVPLRRDVIELLARSRTSYTTTLNITNGGPEGQDYFIVRDHPRDDPKLNRFSPQYVVDVKMQSRTWRELSEYLFPQVAAGAARVQRAGGLVGMGRTARPRARPALGDAGACHGRHDPDRGAACGDDRCRADDRPRRRARQPRTRQVRRPRDPRARTAARHRQHAVDRGRHEERSALRRRHARRALARPATAAAALVLG